MKKLLSLFAVICSLTLITACATPGDDSGGVQNTSKTLKQRINESKDGDIIDAGKEEIEIKDGDSYTVDKAITIRNCDAKSGTFIVEATGAKFENLRNIESVIADEQLDDGDLDIRNCFEIDSVYVNGGGSHSIRIASTHIKNLYVAKEDVRVLLQAEGTNAAKVENVQISTNCKLESEDATAVFEQVQISADVEKVTLAGSANVQKILAETVVTEESTEETKAKVEIESAEVKIDATSANVELSVSENADANVKVPETQIIDTTFKVTTVINGETSSLTVYEGYKFNFKPGEADSGFAGWYTDEAFTTKIELPYLVTKDVVLYAKFVELKAKFFVAGNGFVSSEVGKNYYTDLEVGKVEGASVTTTADYDVITVDNATSTSDVWSYWADSLENWNFKANKNYKISVDIKADVDTLVVLQAKAKNTSSSNQKNVKVTTEWQTVEIETGCWNKDFLGYLQVACGQSKKTYLKNIKMQEVSTNIIPTGVWGPDADSISVTQVENGVKFAFGKEGDEWANGAAIRGNFVETSKNYLYKITFTAVADANNVKFNYAVDSWAEDNAWGSATLGKTATNFELYMPAYQVNGDEIRGAEINISIASKNSVTITNVKFEPLTAIPSDQVILFTSDYDVYKRIYSTGKDDCIELNVAAQKEADLRFVMEKATNSKIEWNNSSSFTKFVNKTSATVSIPDGKDYLVLKNTSNTSQTYRLYIDETWTIVIENVTTDPSVEYTVTYVCTDFEYIGTVDPKTVSAGTEYELPQLDDIEDDDYPKRFGGWYEGVVADEYGDFDFSNATKVDSSYTVTKDVTLYAVWVMDVTLTFVTGYESEGIVVDSIATETYARVDLPTPTVPDGMNIVFEGWYFTDGDDEINWDYAEKVSSPYMVIGRPKLVANWDAVDAPDFFANKAAVTQKDEYGNIIRDDYGNIVIFQQGICDSFYTEQANRYKYQNYIAGTVNGITISKNDSENQVKNTNYVSGTSTEWDYWITSVESFDMNANQNYEVSLEVKADSAQDVRFVLKDYYASVYFDIANVSESVTTEWQTIKFETGTLQANWKAFLEIPVGTIDSLYVRNLKVEAVDTNVLPVKSAKDSVISNRSENGFTVDIVDSSEYIMIPGIKAEYGNIYCISFDISATDTANLSFFYKASTSNYADGGVIQEIDSTSRKITAYVPHVGSDFDIGYNFMSLDFMVDNPTTVTISNFEVTTIDKSDLSMIPNVYLTTDWSKYVELTPCESGESFTTVVVEGYGQSGTIFAMAQDHWEGSFDWFTGAWIDLRTSIKGYNSSNFDLVVEGSEGRACICNRNSVASAYKIWINKNYEIVVEETSYQVTFDLNGGTVDGSGSNITIETIGLSVVTPVKEGYIFKGWTETKDGDDYITSATSDMTVYAKWVSQLQLFEGGDVTGDFAVVQDDAGNWVFSDETGISFVSEGDGVYSATFTYQDYMIGWGSPEGTCQFKARTVAGSWDGVSYGIADSNNQPVIDGEAVSSIAGKDSNIEVSGFVAGTTYKITFTCSESGSVTVQVSTVTE